MTTWQKAVKYVAIALAILLSVGIITVAIKVIGGLIGGNNVLESMQTHEIEQTEQITCLDVELNASEITITTGEAFALESNLKNLRVRTRGNTLIIEEKSEFFFSFSSKKTPKTNLVLPDKVFNEIEIQTGAGKVEIEKLSAKTLSLEFGAGEVFIENVIAETNAEIEGGAGKITVSSGSLRNLEFEMGVGELNFNAYLLGANKLDCGVGAANVTLLGRASDYTVKVSTGIGATYVDGKKADNNASYGNGANTVRVNGGVGEVNVRFEEIIK